MELRRRLYGDMKKDENQDRIEYKKKIIFEEENTQQVLQPESPIVTISAARYAR
jgi:hypothetical protein